RVRWMIASIVGMMAVWLATHAWPFASVYIPKVIAETLAAPTRIEDGLIDLARASAAQTAIAQTSRVLTAAVGGLALMGTIRVLCRAFCCGLPFLSLLAAAPWCGRAPTPRRDAIAQGTLTPILGGMLILSSISTYGTDAATTFTAKEVAAANEMYDEASPHSLVWILAPDTPRKFKNYENFDERRLNIYPAEA